MKNKIFKYNTEEVVRCNRLIGEFMGLIFLDDYSFKTKENRIIKDRGKLRYFSDWNKLMDVIDKIEILGANFEITNHNSHIAWWYSKNKHTIFEGNSCGKWKKPRTPFDSVGGKFYSRDVGVYRTGEKVNCETKLQANYNNVVYFIEWFNKTVLNK